MTDFENKLLKLLEKIDEKLDKLLGAGAPIGAKTSDSIGIPKPSDVVDKQLLEEKMKDKPMVDGRRVCPDCGGTAFKEEEDKSHVLHQMGGMKIYQKKYICKKCGKTL